MLIFALLLFPLFKKRYSQYEKYELSTCICAGLFSLFTIGSALIDSEDIMPTFSKVATYPPLIAYFIMFFFFFEALCYLLFGKLSAVKLSANGTEPSTKNKLIVFGGSMLIMLIMWLPFLLFLYPGVLTQDSVWQLQQAAGMTEPSNHHPILHTMIIKLTFELGQWLFDGDDTKSVFVYSVTQQLFLSACFAYTIETLYKCHVKKGVIIGCLLYYCIPVYHGAYSVSMWKDVWFGGIVAVITALIVRFLSKKEKFKLSVGEAVMLAVFSVGMCLMRSNGIFAFLLLFLVSIFVFFKRNKATLVIMALSLITAFVIKGPIYNSMGVKSVDLIESLSIPVQQISAVASQPSNLTAEQTELLENVVDVEKIGDKYLPHVSDPIKGLVRDRDNQKYISDHKGEFMKLWFSLGLRYPDKYIEAYVNQTCGYWYPDVQEWVTAATCFSDGFDIKRESKTGIFTDFMIYYQNSYIETPILGLFSSIGLGVWVMIFMAAAAIRRHSRNIMIVYIPVIAVLITLMIATPLQSEFRYIYSLFTSLPIFCVIPFIDKNVNDKTAQVSS